MTRSRFAGGMGVAVGLAMFLSGGAAGPVHAAATGPDAVWNAQPDKAVHRIALIGASYINSAIRVGFLKADLKTEADLTMVWIPAVETAYWVPVLENEIRRDTPSVAVFLFRHHRLTQPHYWTAGKHREVLDPAWLHVFGAQSNLLVELAYQADETAMNATNFNACVDRSFLPQLVKRADAAGVQLVFIRQPSREYVNDPAKLQTPDGQRQVQYGREAQAWLEKKGHVFLDYFAAGEELGFKDNHFADGDHMSKAGCQLFTKRIAGELDTVLAALPAPKPAHVQEPPPWAKGLLAATLAAWDARLLLAQSKHGGPVRKFHWSRVARDAGYMNERAPQFVSHGRVAPGALGNTQETINPNRMTGTDRVNIALMMADPEGDAPAQAQAAFYLLAAGRADQAQAYLEKAGDAAAEVRAAFQP